MHAPGRNEWLLGVNFFMDYYVVFDYETKQVGIAESVELGNSPSITTLATDQGIADYPQYPQYLQYPQGLFGQQ